MPDARVTNGERVTFRTVECEDIPVLQRAYADPELRYPLGWDVTSQARLEAEFEGDSGHRLMADARSGSRLSVSPRLVEVAEHGTSQHRT